MVRGRVTDEDGEPMPNAQVAVLRQTFVSGRNHLEQAGAERTQRSGRIPNRGTAGGELLRLRESAAGFQESDRGGGGCGVGTGGRRQGCCRKPGNVVPDDLLSGDAGSQCGGAGRVACGRRFSGELFADAESESEHSRVQW